MKLTDKQRRVLLWMAFGCSYKEIAGYVKTTDRAVEYHWQNIKRKLNIRSYPEAWAYVWSGGLGRRDMLIKKLCGVAVVLLLVSGCSSPRKGVAKPLPPFPKPSTVESPFKSSVVQLPATNAVFKVGWVNAGITPLGTVTEFWSTTNLGVAPFVLKTNVPYGLDQAEFQMTEQEFFICRYRTLNGEVSGWNIK